MATERQISAKRCNGAKGRGPISSGGKAISSMNAVKTGTFAQHILLPDDKAKEFGRWRRALQEEGRPVGPSEFARVERLVASLRRQRRVYHAESGLYRMYRLCPEGVGGVATALATKDGMETEAFTRFQHLDGAVERSVQRTFEMLQTLPADRGLSRLSARRWWFRHTRPTSGPAWSPVLCLWHRSLLALRPSGLFYRL